MPDAWVDEQTGNNTPCVGQDPPQGIWPTIARASVRITETHEKCAMNLSDLLDDAADYEVDPANVRIYLARRLDKCGKPLPEGKVRLDEIGAVQLVDEYQEL